MQTPYRGAASATNQLLDTDAMEVVSVGHHQQSVHSSCSRRRRRRQRVARIDAKQWRDKERSSAKFGYLCTSG